MKLGDLRAAALVVVLALGVLLAWFAARTPAPLEVNAAPEVFSAGRAMVDDHAIAARPHPIGSAEAGLVRTFLVQRLQTLGLEPRTIDSEAVETPRHATVPIVLGGRVENLVGVLKGTDPNLPAVVLMAHTDSVPGSPGAADDAAGVVSALEVVRALKAAGPHRRDVAVLLTDGEEPGLLGAHAFFASGDPLLKHIGEVVNLEARGGGGRVNMFQMGPDDGGHVALFQHAVGDTNANSLTSEVYKYMPNDTDFTVSRNAGFPGYNFAFIGLEFDYHSPSSTPEALDQGALQHMGDQALAITRALADADALPAKGPDAAYSDLLGHAVVAYPAVVGGWAILLLAALIGLTAAWWGQRQEGPGRINPGAAAFTAGGVLVITVVTGVLLWVAALLIRLDDFAGHRAFLAQYPREFVGFLLITLGAALFLAGPVQRGRAWSLLIPAPPTRWSAWLGAFLVLLLITLGLQVKFPPMAALAAWPLLAAALVMAASAVLGRGRFEALGSVLVALVVGVLMLAHLGHFADQTFTAVGEMAPMLLALFLPLTIPLLFPLLDGWGRAGRGPQLFSLLMLGLGVGVLAFATLGDYASARTPKLVQAFYVQDCVTDKSWRASSLDVLDPWSAAALGAPALKPIHQPIEALGPGPIWLTPAAPAGVEHPVFVSSRDGAAVVVHIAPKAGGRELRLTLKTTVPVSDVRLEDRPVALLTKPNTLSYLRWSAPGDGLTLRFTPSGPGELDLSYAEIKDGWPSGQTPPPKPANRMGYGLSDTTVVTHELKTKW